MNLITTFIDLGPIDEVTAALDLLEKIENKFDCSGICRAPLFWYSKNMAEGLPKKSCL